MSNTIRNIRVEARLLIDFSSHCGLFDEILAPSYSLVVRASATMTGVPPCGLW